MDRSISKGIGVGILSLICTSVAPTLNKLALLDYSPIQAVFINVIFGSVFSFLYATSIKNSKPVPRFNLYLLAVALLHGGGLLLFFYSAELLHPFSIGLAGRFYTLISVFFAGFILRETILPIEWILLLFSLVSFSLFEFAGSSSEPFAGVLYGAFYAASFSVSHLLIKKEFSGASQGKILLYVNLISAAILAVPVILQSGELGWHGKSLLFIAAASFFSSFIGTLLFYKSLELLDFASATTLRSLSPIFIALVAIPVFPLMLTLANISAGIAGVLALTCFTYLRSKRRLSLEGNLA